MNEPSFSDNKPLRPEDITIAVTVYSRREFVLDAVASALNQTVSVRVIVVEDCGPDPTIKQLIADKFGSRIAYFRNPTNLGLFDNWNACMDYCSTPWLSILHDDDLLSPTFIESMLDLAQAAPGRSLYFGRAGSLREDRRIEPAPTVTWGTWREIEPLELAEGCFLMFPGQLFRVSDAKQVGGVRKWSFFTGDWDLWLRLVLFHGGAQSSDETGIVRSHVGEDRGTTRVERMGWKWALDNVQRKRNLRLLRLKGISMQFDRRKPLSSAPIPSRYLLRYAYGFSPRWLKYNFWIFTHSSPPNFAYAALQLAARLGGAYSLRFFSQLWTKLTHRHYHPRYNTALTEKK